MKVELDDIVSSDPRVMSGMLVFRGTRIPVEAVYENLADGMSLPDVLRAYPTLDGTKVARLLELTPEILVAERRTAQERKRAEMPS
jgi:uncharacterized protein (DUF433 family)